MAGAGRRRCPKQHLASRPHPSLASRPTAAPSPSPAPPGHPHRVDRRRRVDLAREVQQRRRAVAHHALAAGPAARRLGHEPQQHVQPRLVYEDGGELAAGGHVARKRDGHALLHGAVCGAQHVGALREDAGQRQFVLDARDGLVHAVLGGGAEGCRRGQGEL
jgi:hypothetical protein